MASLASQSLQTSLYCLLFLTFSLIVSSTAEEDDYLGWLCRGRKTQPYAINSTYHSNLLAAFSNLTSLSSTRAFADTTAGSGTGDQVFSLYYCRDDLPLETCHQCVNNATAIIPEYCPSKEFFTITYRECVLAYSNRPIASTVVPDLAISACYFPFTNDRGAMNRTVGPVFEELIDKATSENSTRYFAVGRGNYSEYQSVYCLMQCAPNLSRMQCKECLLDGYNYTLTECASNGMIAGLKSGPSCQVRYSMNPIFNVSSGPPHFPAPIPRRNSSSTSSSGDGNGSRTLLHHLKCGKIYFCVFLLYILFGG